MEGFLDDFVSSLAHHAQDAPARFQAIASAAAGTAASAAIKGRRAIANNDRRTTNVASFWNKPGTPPSSLDLVYITERIIASSEPVHAPVPTFDDTGRDEKANIASVLTSASKKKTTTSKSVPAILSPTNSESISKEGRDENESGENADSMFTPMIGCHQNSCNAASHLGTEQMISAVLIANRPEPGSNSEHIGHVIPPHSFCRGIFL